MPGASFQAAPCSCIPNSNKGEVSKLGWYRVFIFIFDNTIIDKGSLNIISGSVVDFKKELIGESFVIINPKATSSCGCGLSFSI